MTIDPLTLGATILTAAVFDDDVFDEAFGAAVRVNAEGVLISAVGSTRVTDGLPFDKSTVTRLLREEPMAPSSSGTLERAWTFRDAAARARLTRTPCGTGRRAKFARTAHQCCFRGLQQP